jgi:hypothetical protein
MPWNKKSRNWEAGKNGVTRHNSLYFTPQTKMQIARYRGDYSDKLSYHINNHECLIQASVQEMREEAEQGFSARLSLLHLLDYLAQLLNFFSV